MKRAMILFLAALLLSSCALQNKVDNAETGYSLYYLSDGSRKGDDAIQMSLEQLELGENATLSEKAEAVVIRLLQGSQEDPQLVSPVPGNVQLLGLEVRDRRAYVDFSAGFDQLGGVDLALADYCLVLSLTALEGIQSVTITSQGRSVIQQPKQIFFERDVRLLSMEDLMQTVEVVLYFQDSTGAMTGERRRLEIYEGQTLVETLVMELLSGPESRELQAVIPGEVVISSARVENGICYVNFLGESLGVIPQEEETAQKILWSLADSLYSVEAVEEIRILADGQELELFGPVPTDSVAARPQG